MRMSEKSPIDYLALLTIAIIGGAFTGFAIVASFFGFALWVGDFFKFQ